MEDLDKILGDIAQEEEKKDYYDTQRNTKKI